MKQWIYVGSLWILLAGVPAIAADARPGEIRHVDVVPSNGEIRVEVTLSQPAKPSVEVAHAPERLVLKFRGIAADSQQTQIPVNQFGVTAVRYALHRADPPETDLVIDLDVERSYRIASDGAKIVFTVQGPLVASSKRRDGPAGAASRPLFHSLGRRKTPDTSASNGRPEPVLLPPPPSGPPINFPDPNANSSVEAANRDNRPTAAHPNRGSLQEGTVFPNEGSPESGIVPPANNGNTSNLENANSQVSANTPSQPGSAQPALPRPTQAATATPEVATSVRQEGGTSQPPIAGQNVAAKAPPVEAATEKTEKSVPTPAAEPPVSGADATPTSETTANNDSGSGAGRGPIVAHSGENSDFRISFRVKFVAQDAAYLDGGRSAGLTEGMKLVVRDLPATSAVQAEGSDSSAAGDVAELEVLSVAEASAVTAIHEPKRAVKIGDLAYLSSADQAMLVQKNALSATRKYPAVISFTEDDTLDDEARAEVPKPPLPSVNRARGRIGFDTIGIFDHGSGGGGSRSFNLGMVLRADITRINGTYWNVSGYWRGRFNSTNAGPQTLQDLINRTYHLYTTYDNPTSAWVLGFGRMYLPWATSLDTLDGGYAGRKIRRGVTAGVFMGTNPDPSSYSYNPDLEIGGAFVNFEGGSYDDLHYSSTSGGGLKMLKWSPDRPFVFFENNIFYKRVFSIYQASQIDSAAGYWYVNPTTSTRTFQPGTPFGLGRNFLTLRIQPHPRVEFNFNHNYFRDLPTFDPTLAGTGLLDKYLMQGFSAGARVEVLKQIWLSTDLGLSNRSGDAKHSLNQMYGITFGRLPWIGLHADARYTRFNSGFGSGSYEALSFSKNINEALELQVLAGQQNFSSTLTSATHSRFVNALVETSLGDHYFIQAGGTVSRGGAMSYDQVMFTFGYRFDNRHGHRGQ